MSGASNPSRKLSGLTLLAVAVAMAAAGFWLWTIFCGFPWSAWNDIRLVPTFMAAAGENVYSPPGSGIVSTWMYGPGPLWAWWPATLASTAVAAIQSAAVLNIGYLLMGIATTCLFWPLLASDRLTRILSLAVCVSLWPRSSFHYLQADNVAVTFGLIANVLLVQDRGSVGRWLAAGATAVALASKQIAGGLLLAQLVWVFQERSRREACWQALRTSTALAVVGALAVWQFGFAGLWFGVVQIPAHLPWTGDPLKRVLELGLPLLVMIGIPAVILIVARRKIFRRGHPLKLPFLCWLCCLPLGLAALMKEGGAINSLQGFSYLLPALVVLALTPLSERFSRPQASWAIATIVLAVLAIRWPMTPGRPLRPLTFHLEQGAQICALYPGKVWFPWDPLITYYADRRFYHAEDGLYVRALTGFPVDESQLMQGLPNNIQKVSMIGSEWGLAVARTTGESGAQSVGAWKVYQWKDQTPLRAPLPSSHEPKNFP